MPWYPTIRVDWSSKSKDATSPETPKEPDLRDLHRSWMTRVNGIIPSNLPKIECPAGKTLLFEYGDMMAGKNHHDDLGQSEWVNNAYTVPRFSLWNKWQGKHSFPIALNMSDETTQRAKIRGQLLRIPEETLEVLDKYRGKGVHFARRVVPLLIPINQRRIIVNGEVGEKRDSRMLSDEYILKPARAWMYVGLKSSWRAPIEWDRSFFKRSGSNFSLATLFRDWNLNRAYYKFDDPLRVPIQNPTRYLRLRSSYDQNRMEEIDITEEEEWLKQQKAALNEQQTYPKSSVS